MRFSVVNLGCKVNKVESDAITASLLERGAVAADDPDVVVVNTCTVTGEAEKKARKAVRRALREAPGARVVVTGCAAVISPDEFLALDERVSVVPKARVVDAAVAAASAAGDPPDPSLASAGPGDDGAPTVEDRVRAGRRTRVGVKVQDGCDNACSYCIVHVARGRARSRDAAACVDEVARLGRAGVPEAVLTGIDIGRYENDGVDLAGLLLRMRAAAPRTRLRVSSCEPAGVSDALLDVLATSDGMVCRHLHVPLQSGSSRVLAQMNRPYTADEYARLVERARSRVPSLSLSTDVIVGFPGETEQDFQDTLGLARACGFSKVHVFRYSRREGTPAAERADQVPPEVKADRAHRLAALARELRVEDAKRRVGGLERVVAMADGRGMSESYHGVVVDGAIEPGSMEERRIVGARQDGALLI